MMEQTEKTNDVEINEDVSFRDMMLSEHVLAGLTKCNFAKPSPIQLRAIPIGRCGLDLIIQSKSGTGKTLVFCTVILERYNPELKTPQSLIVVPTREIALQVESYLRSIGSCLAGFSVTSVIGGRDIADDRKRISKCRAIVGTPGRILHLIKNNFVCLQNIQTLVLDEADKLVTEDFYHDINILLNALDKNRQIISSSATYANGLDKLIVSLMHNPIAVSTARDTPVLIGVRQFLLPVDAFSLQHSTSNPSIQAMWRKVSAVQYVLRTTSFKQCILFSNSQFRANSFANYLTQNKWTVELILGSHDQTTRTATIQKFRQYESRILVTSDLMARGVDIVNINLVINLDVPSDSSTYLHRIGRCGRFGRRGLAITLVDGEAEMAKFQNLLRIIGSNKMKVEKFPVNLNGSSNFDAWSSESPENYCMFGEDENVCLLQEGKRTNEPSNEKSDVVREKSEIERTNVNLLEAARLMIETEPNRKQPVVDIDIDLFSSYEKKNDTSASSPPNEELDLTQDNDASNYSVDEQPEAATEIENLNLHEVAKLLIDTDSSIKPAAIDLDDDLFSCYEQRDDSDTVCKRAANENPIDVFEDFIKLKSAENENGREQSKEPTERENIAQDRKSTEQNRGKFDHQEKSKQDLKKDRHHEKRKQNGVIISKNEEINERKTKKSHSMVENHQPVVQWPVANSSWTKIYLQQLSDINRYVANAYYRKSNF